MNDIEALLSKMYHPGLKAIEPGLERIQRFLKRFDRPQNRLPPVIHVAGTNGKGSLLAYLYAIFTAAGYKAHRYTSPHLVRFNERIQISGEPVSDDYLRDLLQRVVTHIEDEPVTFFEATTAMAFQAFSEHPADIVLLETGMGGRWDATNVIDNPLLTAITPISLDHTAFLGPTIADIAFEKAGIMKKNRPCVLGRQGSEAAAVLTQQAEEKSVPLYRHSFDWEVLPQGKGAVFSSPERTLGLIPALAGTHQIDNAATAVACIDKLPPQFFVSGAHIREGLASAVWPGRLQQLKGSYAQMLPKGVELWLDGGHNPQGGEMLANWLRARKAQEIYLICGMVKGKDTWAYLEKLAPQVTALYGVAIKDEDTSQPAEQIEMAAKGLGIPASSCISVEKALQTIARRAKTPAIICICGSLYLAGKVLSASEGS